LSGHAKKYGLDKLDLVPIQVPADSDIVYPYRQTAIVGMLQRYAFVDE